MHRVACHLDETEISVPTHVVEHEIQTLALTGWQRRAVNVEYLTGGMLRKLGIYQARAGLSRPIRGANQLDYLKWNEVLTLGIAGFEKPVGFVGNVEQRADCRGSRLQIKHAASRTIGKIRQSKSEILRIVHQSF